MWGAGKHDDGDVGVETGQAGQAGDKGQLGDPRGSDGGQVGDELVEVGGGSSASVPAKWCPPTYSEIMGPINARSPMMSLRRPSWNQRKTAIASSSDESVA